jgi:hypothetical protein
MSYTRDIGWLHHLRHQAVRDLAWCALSEPLMPLRRDIGLPQRLMKVHFAPHFFHALDQHPEPLFDHIAQHTCHKLGLYFESLWCFLFEHTPDWRLLAHNLPVYEQQRTVGAFDFLCAQHNTFWHIEAAVKFYLYDDSYSHNNSCMNAHIDNISAWFGPHREDQLAKKVERLLNHQLPLNQHPAGRETLLSTFPDIRLWQSGVCFQGYLFWPARTALLPPATTIQDTEQYRWWHQTAAKKHLSGIPDRRWKILDKALWLSPAQAHIDDNGLLNDEGLYHVLNTPIANPLLVVCMTKERGYSPRPTHLVEATRLFIVADDWSAIPYSA